MSHLRENKSSFELFLQAVNPKEFIGNLFTIWGSFYLLYYLYESILRYQRKDIQITERFVTSKEDGVTLPLITLCPRFLNSVPVNEHVHDQLFDSVIASNYRFRKHIFETK